MAKRKNAKITKKSLPVIIIVAIICLITGLLEKTDVISSPTANTAETTDSILTAHFLDVGQGDCALFISGEDTMLIDSGEKEYADTVLRDLESYGVTELDYVVVTHAHSDHMGAMADILNTVPTETIIFSEPSEKSSGTKTYGEFLDAADKSDAEIILAEPDYTFSFGNAECRILAPFSVSEDEENNNSVVMLITAGSTSFLMTGDAEKSVEKELLEKYPYLTATILKAGHHGSRTSSHNKFVDSLDSEAAVISVGEDNNYGHPTQEVLDILQKHNISCYRTDLDGTVTVECYENNYTVSTKR